MTFKRERLAGAATDEMLAAVDVADMLVKRGVPFRQSHGIVAGLVRTAVESGRVLSQLTREELAQHSDVLDDDFYAVLSQARGWSPRRARAGRRWRGCASSSPTRRRRWTRRPRRVVLRPAGARGGTGPAGLRRRARRLRRPDRRDRGLPLLRAGVPRVRGRHAAYGGPAAARPGWPTSTAPTASTPCSTRSASPRASARRC